MDDRPNFRSGVRELDQRISTSELVKFLRQLAAIYKSPLTGNIPLSNALGDLAIWVSARPSSLKTSKSSTKKKAQEKTKLERSQLEQLDPDGINEFLKDANKSKEDLLDLASARFSIPTSQLKRQNINRVRDTIKSALLHEASIGIISQEAKRDGQNRSS